MSTVAEQLRATREARKLTIEQVADMTKIRTDHVRALEEGDFSAFSATIYIRGSVKNYANLLKLDVPEMMAMLDAELKGTEKFSEPPPLTEQKKSIVDDIALMVAKLNWKMGFAGIGIIVLGIIAVSGFLAWKHHQRNDPLKNLPPAVYQPSGAGDTLPLPKR